MSLWLGMRVRSAALTSILALLLAAIPGDVARAQTSEEAAPQPPAAAEPLPVADFSKPMGPPDPFNRGTPRSSVDTQHALAH